ncbi:MAG: HAD family phosphatase [Spirochaetae bacterium HGW-Spirochaetae-3]|jgi:putative hydrolase of the HAD superfamily|nr:MAG: HAD family phosphatase [Spirochaetae bacterium HGW-Spirochaetae-3]
MMLYIFDMGGVLVRSFDVIPAAARLSGMSEPDFRRFAAADMDALMVGSMGADEYWSRFSAASGATVPEDYWSTLFAPELDPAVERLIRGLREENRVVSGTNTVACHYGYLESRGMYGCFDAVYASHLMGLCKPDPSFWLEILRAEGRDPEDAFFIDDMEENVAVARGLGIRSHLFRDAESLETALEEEPEVAIARPRTGG